MIELKIMVDKFFVMFIRMIKMVRAVVFGAPPPPPKTTVVTEVLFEDLPPEIQELARRANS